MNQLALMLSFVAMIGFEVTAIAQENVDEMTIEETFLFYPLKYPEGDWQPQDLKYADVAFSAEDGTKLHGWFCKADTPHAVLLYAHGNAGNIATRGWWLRELCQQGNLSVFAFDYRGYGKSEGKPSVKTLMSDAETARSKLRELANVKDTEIILMGESLGGAVAIHLAAKSAPRALIIQSTFTSMRDVAKIHFPKLAWLVPRSKLDSLSSIRLVSCPVLQSHGTNDRTIPIELGRQLFDATNEPKTFVEIAGADHNDWLTRTYAESMSSFINQLPAP